MFRELTRIKQQISNEECIEILKNEPRGVLSVLGDDDYPYALPINFYYDEKENMIYFHGGKTGHKMDAIAKHDKASFCVYDKGYHKDGHWSLNIRSVIVFGRIKVVDNWSVDKIIDLSKKYTQDMDYIENEITQFAKNTAVLELEIEHMTGKLVNEA
ncbi:MAG: pyridoxamine 5'-phosphate oxidase family protein [Clostridia bacterium]|nr:pyridoxamine 5'-phosphate oxidase family protein [Clostridia bacterium]